MAEDISKHLIQAIYQVKGWNLYKQTVDKSGKITSQVYKQQVREGDKVVNMTKTLSKNNVALSKTFTQATTRQNDLVKALRRAAIVAPVWLALRSVMMGTLRLITEGAKTWEEFDKALLKARAVIKVSTGDINTAFSQLQESVEELSIKTGVALEKITTAFFRFGTLGIEFEDALAGATASLNIALALGGDLEQVARPLAFAYKLLGDTLDQTIPPAQRLEILGSKLFAVWKINAFELNGFSQSLNNFLPTANTANFTLDQTVALLTALSSSAILGARGGRLLRQSIAKLIGNMDKLASELGIAVNPELESTFEILVRVLGRMKELGESGSIKRAGTAIANIFGGARTGEAIRGLITVFDLLQKNIDITNPGIKELNTLLEEYEGRLDEVENSLGRQLEIGRNLNKQIGKAFLQGVFGGEKYVDTLKNINNLKERTIILSEAIGFQIRDSLSLGIASWQKWREEVGKTEDILKKAMEGGLGAAEIDKLIEDIRKKKIELPLFVNRTQIIQDLQETLKDMERKRETLNNIVFIDVETGERHTELPEILEKEKETVKLINGENQIKLKLLQEELSISKLQLTGLSKTEMAQKTITAEIKERVQQFNKLEDRERLGFQRLEEQQILRLLERQEFEKIIELTGDQILNQEKVLELAKMMKDVELARFQDNQSRITLLLQHEANLLKLRGANNRQLIEFNIELDKQLGRNQDGISLLKKQLALEIAIKKEKEAQTKLSSDTIKLFEISQKHGIMAAREIGQFLQGKMTFQTLQTRESFNIFKEFFPQMEKTMEALKFFTRGMGRGVPIGEEAIREPKTSGAKSRRIAKRIGEIPEAPLVVPKVDINTTIQQIEIKLPDGSLERMAEETGKQVTDRLLTDESLRKLLAKAIRPYI